MLIISSLSLTYRGNETSCRQLPPQWMRPIPNAEVYSPNQVTLSSEIVSYSHL